jgi:hypothetical protein
VELLELETPAETSEFGDKKEMMMRCLLRWWMGWTLFSSLLLNDEIVSIQVLPMSNLKLLEIVSFHQITNINFYRVNHPTTTSQHAQSYSCLSHDLNSKIDYQSTRML